MTEQTVQIIITLKVNENDLSYERPIDISNLEKDIGSFSQEIGSQLLSVMLKMLDDMLCDIVPDGWKNVGTEKRSVLFECGYVHFKRRIYQDTEGARHKPLDELLELEPWQRSSRALEEMSSALAATNTYRKASSLLSWLVKAAISPSTIGRYLRKTGQRIQEQERMATEGEEQGHIKTEVLYAEADGVHISLQREKEKGRSQSEHHLYGQRSYWERSKSLYKQGMYHAVGCQQRGMADENAGYHLSLLCF